MVELKTIAPAAIPSALEMAKRYRMLNEPHEAESICLDILEVEPDRVVLQLANRRGVRNHIGGVHAAAMALLAETASGLVLGMNVRDSAVPVLREMNMSYVARATGGLQAVATLDETARRSVQESDRGDLQVPVFVTDAAGQAPVECLMSWAWRPGR